MVPWPSQKENRSIFFSVCNDLFYGSKVLQNVPKNLNSEVTLGQLDCYFIAILRVPFPNAPALRLEGMEREDMDQEIKEVDYFSHKIAMPYWMW